MKTDAELTQGNRQRGFWWLFITQFQGAFSDNVLKWLVISLITGMGFSNDRRDQLVGVVGALFALPFILFSLTVSANDPSPSASSYLKFSSCCSRSAGWRPTVSTSPSRAFF